MPHFLFPLALTLVKNEHLFLNTVRGSCVEGAWHARVEDALFFEANGEVLAKEIDLFRLTRSLQ